MLSFKLIFQALSVFVILFTQLTVCNKLDYYVRSDKPPDPVIIQNETVENTNNVRHATASPARPITPKKWQVGRVSRKQYEIVNMLWRKTNIFNDVDGSPESRHNKKRDKKNKEQHSTGVTTLSRTPATEFSTPTTTISYIEFYYLDEYVDPITAKPEKTTTEEKMLPSPNVCDQKHYISRSPLFAFHVNKPAYTRITKSQTKKEDEHLRGPALTVKQQTISIEKELDKRNVLDTNPNSSSDTHFLQKYLTRSTAAEVEVTNPTTTVTSTTEQQVFMKNISEAMSESYTIPNDRIKFFELYDSNTKSPGKVMQVELQNEYLNSYIENEISNKKVRLEDVDKDLEYSHNRIGYMEKHAGGFKDKREELSPSKKFAIKNKVQNDTTSEPSVTTAEDIFVNITKMAHYEIPMWKTISKSNFSSSSRAPWFKYPFTAIYVYERFQVHCDAASISPHWLIAAASCLSRHREDPRGGDRSAFVTYCGENWWNPERITYVKYTLVHPRYHPNDNLRRHQYNIGVIQVVASMSSSCPSWSPVSLISHHFVTEMTGTLGTAVGWGLDRYDTSYASSDLPRRLLSVYDSLIYSNSCPGNTGYSNTKALNEEAITNVYCLALPPYSGEERDPVHGGLLLVGGKLIALYLQEERRRYGEQSAQYTGIWRLVPWIHDVAREPDEMDFFF